jgi:hypothetical protein
MDKSKSQALKLKALKYCFVDNQLYWKDHLGILLKCVDEDESLRIMIEIHQGACGGHHFWMTTAYEIIRVGYYWPSLFSDVYDRVRACVECQKFMGKEKILPLPLKHISVEDPFQ